jgi:hypothetical protein
LDTFAAKHMPKRVTSSRRLPLMPHEQAFLDKLNVRELDEILAGNWGVMTPTLREQLADYMRAITPALPAAIDEVAAEYNNPALLYYGARYTDANPEGLAGLLRMTAGSKFMADLQQVGLWRKLQWAFVQRSYLRRRLTSLRITEAP